MQWGVAVVAPGIRICAEFGKELNNLQMSKIRRRMQYGPAVPGLSTIRVTFEVPPLNDTNNGVRLSFALRELTYCERSMTKVFAHVTL